MSPTASPSDGPKSDSPYRHYPTETKHDPTCWRKKHAQRELAPWHQWSALVASRRWDCPACFLEKAEKWIPHRLREGSHFLRAGRKLSTRFVTEEEFKPEGRLDLGERLSRDGEWYYQVPVEGGRLMITTAPGDQPVAPDQLEDVLWYLLDNLVPEGRRGRRMGGNFGRVGPSQPMIVKLADERKVADAHPFGKWKETKRGPITLPQELAFLEQEGIPVFFHSKASYEFALPSVWPPAPKFILGLALRDGCGPQGWEDTPEAWEWYRDAL